eukprot:12895657-Prorocentrum_lima.AAC.1
MHKDSPESPKVQRVMWLGRPNDTIDHMGTWEEMVEKSIKEGLREELEALSWLEQQINDALCQASEVAMDHHFNDVPALWLQL